MKTYNVFITLYQRADNQIQENTGYKNSLSRHFLHSAAH